MADTESKHAQPPRENLVRALPKSPELRMAEAGMPTMAGHFAVFDQWTHINSAWEGEFMERVAPGAFTKTFNESRGGMRVLFQHGQDPSIGEKVLGPIGELREDSEGAYFEVPLLDTSYNRDLLPGLEQGLYGTSFRFGVVKEQFNRRAKPSEYNPDGLPERTILEARVPEFGPVTFPAYAGASVGIRSMTDEYILRRLGNPERVHALLSELHSSQEPVKTTPKPGAAANVTARKSMTQEEWNQWLSRTSTNSAR